MLVLNISHLVKDTMRVTAIVIYILITVANSKLTRKVRIPLCKSETVNMYRISDPGVASRVIMLQGMYITLNWSNRSIGMLT